MTEDEKRSQEMVTTLTKLDLIHHSLRIEGERIVLEAGEPGASALSDLRERPLELAKDCGQLLQGLRDGLDAADLDLWRSVLSRVDLATRRLSGATTHTLLMVNVWRVIDACDAFLSSAAAKYGYSRVAEELEREPAQGEGSTSADLAKLFAEYENAMAGRLPPPNQFDPPFEHGILRWRGSQLFHVERVEDGVRWIELDPDFELQIIAEASGGLEVVEGRTVEGYPINLMLDVEVDEHAVDDYIQRQEGHEYHVSGYQVVTERRGKGAGPVRRR